MISFPHKRRRTFFLLAAANAIVMIGMLYFGIRQRGYQPGNNNVRWSDDGPGLTFDRYAQAYTNGFFSAQENNPSGLTIEIAIRPQIPADLDFKFIVLVHDGEDDRQLLIGQWRSSLIVMNGDDYSNKRRTPKIYQELKGQQKGPRFITVVSDADGTQVFLDGKLTKRRNALVLKYPEKGASTKLVIGNNLRGNHTWVGTVMGLAFYDRRLNDEAVHQHYLRWCASHDFNAFATEEPRLLYAFDEGRGQTVSNKIGKGQDLKLPPWMKVLRREVLSWPRWEIFERSSGLEDMLINLLGFLPLGFLLMAVSSTLEGVGMRRGLFATLLVGFSFSLGIEIVQVWIPSRSSSMLDLILNTLGDGIGAMIFVKKGMLWSGLHF